MGSHDDGGSSEAGTNGVDAPAQHDGGEVSSADEGGILGGRVADKGDVPRRVAVFDQRGEAERVLGVRDAIVEDIDAAEELGVDHGGNGRSERRGGQWEQGVDGGETVGLPDEAGGTERKVISTAGRVALVVIEAAGGGIGDQADVPDKGGSGDNGGVAGADQDVIGAGRGEAEGEAEGSVGEGVVGVEDAGVGDEQRWRGLVHGAILPGR